eukprot:1159206-Pelagomonas_calceolata.AAC.7
MALLCCVLLMPLFNHHSHVLQTATRHHNAVRLPQPRALRPHHTTSHCHEATTTTTHTCVHARTHTCTGEQATLLELLEVPQLMDTCVRNGVYDEALDLQAFVGRMGLLHPDVPLVNLLMTQTSAPAWLPLLLL